MNYEIDEFKKSTHHISFKCNGVECQLWDSNKYYAWLSRGSIGDYEWDRKRPTTSTMAAFKEYLMDYSNEKINVVLAQLQDTYRK
jgi:hypothetical protein